MVDIAETLIFDTYLDIFSLGVFLSLFQVFILIDSIRNKFESPISPSYCSNYYLVSFLSFFVRRTHVNSTQAGCVECHSGRYFTNNHVIAEQDIKSQPSRAKAQAPVARNFVAPQTYPSNVSVPLPANPPVLEVPTDITLEQDFKLAFAIGNPGGYKVPSLIGLHVTAPYLHDGGTTAGPQALKVEKDGYEIVNPEQLGIPGTLLNGILPDPSTSLRVLVGRNLRREVVLANRAHRDLQKSNADGSGHNYWVDKQAGFSTEDQTDLIEFLLSLDDDPEVLPVQAK